MRAHLWIPAVFAIAACNSPAAEITAATVSPLAADRQPLPTTHGLIRAGNPYIPVLDDQPLAVDGAAPCVKAPTVELTLGQTALDAQVIATRRELLNRLDLGIEGVPINVAKLSGATGTAQLAIDTTLDESSLNIIFQAKGTFESAVTAVGAIPKFDPARVSSCGWGYVSRAHHRLASVVMVTIEATDRRQGVLIGCAAGDTTCKGTGISTPVGSAKASIEATLRAGSYDIAIRTLSDAIPGLPDKPLGDMVQLSTASDDDADKDKKITDLMAKLSNALDWLGKAETSIQSYMTSITEDPTKNNAPTALVDFTYYDGVSDAQRASLATTFDGVVELRDAYDVTVGRIGAWSLFEDGETQGIGHMFNVPGAPLARVEDIDARAEAAIGDAGILTRRRSDLEDALATCERAAQTSDTGNIAQACAPLAVPAWDKTYDTQYGIRRIAPTTIKSDGYQFWPSQNCPDGQRLARVDEAPLLAPASVATNTSDSQGIWLDLENPLALAPYVQAGAVSRRPPFFVWMKNVVMCFPNTGLFTAPSP